MSTVEEEGAWLRAQRQRRGWTAADVARVAVEQAAEAGVPISLTQQAVSAFENGRLKTVPMWVSWVRRAVDDVPAGAAPAAAQVIPMSVMLPSEAALARMFEGLLRPLDRTAPVDELARILAQRLPNGLARLATALPPEATAPETVPDAAPPPPATDHPASQRGSRT